MMNMGNFGGMGFGFGWIFMILFWALIILGITYFVKQLLGSSKTSSGIESAEEILTLLERLNSEFKKTIVMVTHDPRAADKAHTIRHLEKGILEETNHK